MNKDMNYLEVCSVRKPKICISRRFIRAVVAYCLFVVVSASSFMSTLFICNVENIHICRLSKLLGKDCLIFSREYSDDADLFKNCGLNVTPGEESFITDGVFVYEDTCVHYSIYNYLGIRVIRFKGSIEPTALRHIEDNVRVLLSGLGGRNVNI